MGNFKTFADQINTRFGQLQNNRDLFVVSSSGDELYAHYLASFPEGTNPLFRERTEYDCSNCKNFIRNFGGVVAINLDTLSLETLWDGMDFESPYNVVAAGMREFIGAQEIGGLFRVGQPSFSAQTTRKQGEERIETYHHFYGVAAPKFVTKDGAQAGEYATSVQVLTDSFERLNPGAINAVLDLIRDKQIYRGEEHLGKVELFWDALARYLALGSGLRRRYIAVMAVNMAVSRFKNSVIGTLVADLAEGEDVEAAVRSFETKVAPANYQRTAQVVSQRMVDDALKLIDDLGLKVGRRMAKLEDVSVNNVLWVDSSTRPLMKDGLAGLLAGAVARKAPTVDAKQITEIGIEQFLSGVLPQAQSVKVLIAPDLANSFMSLTTATEEGGPDLFKWNNPFAWSYAGGVTDMITERVKAAGGNIKALLRFSLSWTNTDDLDINLTYQGKGREYLYFGHKSSTLTGLRGGLDVDMNVHGETRTPVENIAFTTLLPGTYAVAVNNFNKRESRDVGFTLQVADGVGVTNYIYGAAVNHKATVSCITATVDAHGGVTYQIDPALKHASSSVTGEKWGVPFGHYAEVSSVMLSPNYWDDNAVGNKHWFFVLKDARADEQPRGIYNEYLNAALTKHRKVFDVIGERTKPEIQDEQLSGIGVSSTLRKTVTAEVTTASTKRIYAVQF